LRRRSFTGSMPVTRAASSIARSSMKFASGRPAPRYGAVGVVLVKTQRTFMSMRAMSYMPGRQRVRFSVWMLAPTAPI